MSEPLVRVTFPNGGERLQPGQQVTVQWESSDDFGLIAHDVKFSPTGDGGFTDIATNLPGFSRAFLWTVPNIQTTQGLIRVVARNALGNQNGDRSDAPFTIGQMQPTDTVPPTVQVTFPNGGQQFQPGQPVTIQWISSDNVGVVAHDVKFSATGGEPFQDIAVNLPGFQQSFGWIVPNLQTTQGVIRVVARDAAGNQAGDRSDSFFTISQPIDTVPPTVQVTFPNGGQQFQAGQQVTIQWTSSDNVGVVAHDVKFSATGGEPFQDIATNLPGSQKSFNWIVPNVQTAQGVIRVVARDAAGNQAGDRSDSFFSIGPVPDTVPPTVQVTFPNGGQQFQPGQPVTTQWISSDNVGVIAHDVKFSATGGEPFQDIAVNLPGFQQSFNWIVPNVQTTQGVIRVVARDAAGNQGGDRSDTFFTIAQPIDTVPPTVQVTFPNGGQQFQPGQQVTIQWTSSDNVGVVAHDVKFSATGGDPFQDIATNLPGAQKSFNWIVPNTPTNQGVIRVVARDAAGNQGGDRSDAFFVIAQPIDTIPPTVQVTFPNGGQQFQPGQQVTIQWTSSDNVGVVAHDVKFSPTGGEPFQDIVTNLPGAQKSFLWTVPNVQTTQGAIRVVARDAAGNQGGDRSDSFFTIGPVPDTVPPTVRVLFPNGNESFQPGQQVTIQWTSSDNVGIVAHDVKFSATGGEPFADIITNLPGSAQSFPWTVPNIPTTQGVIRVVARDAAGNQGGDRSDAFFTIEPAIDTLPPTVRVTFPNGGESFLAGQQVTIQWTSSDNVGVVAHDVKFSATGGNPFMDIATNLPGNAQSFSWTVPDVQATQAVIRVTARDAAGNQGGDRSDGVFTIAAATIEDTDEQPVIDPQKVVAAVAGRTADIDRRARFKRNGVLVKECVGRIVLPRQPAPPQPFGFTIIPALVGRCGPQEIETCNVNESGNCGRYVVRAAPPVNTPPATYTFDLQSTKTGQIFSDKPFSVTILQPKVMIVARPRQQPTIFAGEQIDYDVEVRRTAFVGPVKLRIRPGTEVDLSENVFIPQEFPSNADPDGNGVDRTVLTIITTKPQAEVSPGTGKGTYRPVIEVETFPFVQVTTAQLELQVEIRPDIDVTISPDRLSAAPEEKAVFTVDLFKYAFQEQDDLRVTGQPTGSKVDFIPAGTKMIKAGKRDRFNLEITPPAGTMPIQFPLTVTAPFTRNGMVKTPSAMAILKVEPVDKRLVLSFRSPSSIPGDVRVLECASFDFQVAALGFSAAEPVSLSFQRSPSMDLIRGAFVLPNGSTGTTFTPDLNDAEKNIVKLRFEVPVDLSRDQIRIKYDFDIVAKLASDPKIASNTISGAFTVFYDLPEIELVPIDPAPVGEESTARGSSITANFGFDIPRGTPGCPLFFDQPVTLKVNPNLLPRGVFVAGIQQPMGTTPGSTLPGFVRFGTTLEARADRYRIPIEGDTVGGRVIPKEVTLVVTDDVIQVTAPGASDVFQGFEQATVMWTPLVPLEVDVYEIELSIDGGQQFDKVGQTGGAIRTFIFEISNSRLSEENDAQIRVVAKNRFGQTLGSGRSALFKIFRTDRPTIETFDPQGNRGDTVKITGTEFVKGRTTVRFAPNIRVNANVTDSKNLTVQVPLQAITGPLNVANPVGSDDTPFRSASSCPPSGLPP